ncbi:hypothetical protein MCHI_000187 [Candidatus Magnetoovum chiemensis]|nr:hypothetical protein MCHI_000187 [Candidatus Magnetoovum chiemensis]
MLTAKEEENANIAKDAEEKIKLLTDEHDKKIQEYTANLSNITKQLDEKNTIINDKDKIIASLDTKTSQLDILLAKQRKDYSTLEDKYNKLIKPSRSPVGKAVVTVYYYKNNGAYSIKFTDVDANDTKEITDQQLHNTLSELKNKYQNKLYVKIVIPESSILTFNEAWTFTNDILSRYDYYYQ